MKNQFFNFVILFVYNISIAQDIRNEEYNLDTNFVRFKTEKQIEFCLPKFSGFGTVSYSGAGSYKIYEKKKKLKIFLKKGYLLGSQSTYISAHDNKIKGIKILVCDENNFPIADAAITINNNEAVYSTNNYGIAYLDTIALNEIIEIDKFVYQSLRIPYLGKDNVFKVVLKLGQFGYYEYFNSKSLTLFFERKGQSILCGFPGEKGRNILFLKKIGN